MSGITSNASAASSLPIRQIKASNVIPYEQHLDQDRRWALSEGSLFFEGRGKVQEALRRITSRLNELGISYAVVDGMALFQHGYRRFTEDVDLLVTRESLKQIHAKLEGLGMSARSQTVRTFATLTQGLKSSF